MRILIGLAVHSFDKACQDAGLDKSQIDKLRTSFVNEVLNEVEKGERLLLENKQKHRRNWLVREGKPIGDDHLVLNGRI